jgi:hypothetical protein
LVKAPDFDSGIRRFESFFPSHSKFLSSGQVASAYLPVLLWLAALLTSQRCPEECEHGLRQLDGFHWQRQSQTGRRRRQAQLNIDLGRANVGRFSDGEISVELQEHVRGNDIFILQSTCAPCQRKPDGTAGHGRFVETRLGRPDHRRHPVLWLCPPGSSRRARSACRSPPNWSPTCWLLPGSPRFDHGPARRADPGILQHPGR